MNIQDILNNINEEDQTIQFKPHDRVLVIDGLNLFFRNFATLNMTNPNGAHIGGLGGFLRSLGTLINKVQPTSIYIVFDGKGSTTNRKNINPEYKANRNINRITNWDTFQSLEDEHDSKIDQLLRLVQYLKLLPVKILSFDKAEADDIISVLCQKLSYGKNKSFIVSSDKDFLQLVDNHITVYRPTEKKFYTFEDVEASFGIHPDNFLLYKCLVGDNSDNVKGIKGLGKKTIIKRIPEVLTEKVTLEKLHNICEERLGTNISYARILDDFKVIENNYKIMNLTDPMVNDQHIEGVEQIISDNELNYYPEEFESLHNNDKLGNLIRNPQHWVKNYFEEIYKISKNS